jgi:hypothetical protein
MGRRVKMVDTNRWWNTSSMAKQWAFVIDLDFYSYNNIHFAILIEKYNELRAPCSG